jgi:predicted hydrocarbon binding protein
MEADSRSRNGDVADILQRDTDGTLKDKMTDAHVFILSRSAFRSMQETLYDKFLSGASVILYEMGEGYGKKLASALRKIGLGKEQAMRAMEQTAFLAGWGEVRFQSTENSRLVCAVRNSMFSVKRRGLSNSCYFLAGVLGGVSSVLFDQTLVAKEVQCAMSGHELCKFAVEPVA